MDEATHVAATSDPEFQCKLDFIKLCDKHAKTIAVLNNNDVVDHASSSEERARRIQMDTIRRKIHGVTQRESIGLKEPETGHYVVTERPIIWGWAWDRIMLDPGVLERIVDRPDFLEAMKDLPTLQIDAQAFQTTYKDILDNRSIAASR